MRVDILVGDSRARLDPIASRRVLDANPDLAERARRAADEGADAIVLGIRFLDPVEVENRFRERLRPWASLAAAVRAPILLLEEAGVTDPVVLAARLRDAVTRAKPLVEGNEDVATALLQEFLQLNSTSSPYAPDRCPRRQLA